VAGIHVERRLAAVLAADVVGYARLVERDEQSTLARLKACRKVLIEPLLAEHHGRIVKLIGDGILCEFASVVDAVACAIAIQRGMDERERGFPEPERLRFRIGVNLGDIVVDENDIYGDGVNVAARLEGVAKPGEIAVSGTAYDHLQGKLACGFTFLGDQQLKNLKRPVRVYQVDRQQDGNQAARPVLASPRPSNAPATIAVLPFLNLSGDQAQSYFSDGITEDIITELSRFRPLAVIARTSSFQFRDKALSVQEIGRVLGAAFIVEGSIRRSGERVRITAQLVEASTGRHLWAERYDRDLTDLFAVQDEVVRNLVSTVSTRLSEEIRETARRKPPEDLDAYDCFLRGNQLMDGTPQEQAEATALFERARVLDPGFARAYTGLVGVTMMRSFAPMPLPAAAALVDEALVLADQALRLDPGDARIHSSVGWICLFHRDFEHARQHFDRARAMNPNDSIILVTWAWARACLGETEPALAAAGEAQRLNPWLHWYPARIEFLARHHAEALAHLEAAPSRGPRWSAWRAAILRLRLGRVTRFTWSMNATDGGIGGYRGPAASTWSDHRVVPGRGCVRVGGFSPLWQWVQSLDGG
jgi:adenylate cyclase